MHLSFAGPPFNLKACQEGCFVKLSWSKKPEKSPTNRIQEFKIYYTHNDNWDGHQHEMVAADILHYYFSKLLPTKTYRFKVAACLNNLVESKCSEEETFVTRCKSTIVTSFRVTFILYELKEINIIQFLS